MLIIQTNSRITFPMLFFKGGIKEKVIAHPSNKKHPKEKSKKEQI